MSDKNRVLLVDDVPGARANFAEAFGPALHVASSVDRLNDLLRSGAQWDTAFVDFNLLSSTNTGLTTPPPPPRAPADAAGHVQPVQ